MNLFLEKIHIKIFCDMLRDSRYITTAFFPFQKDGRIDIEELESQYSTLGYKSRKMTEYGCSEVEDVIWEVSCMYYIKEFPKNQLI